MCNPAEGFGSSNWGIDAKPYDKGVAPTAFAYLLKQYETSDDRIVLPMMEVLEGLKKVFLSSCSNLHLLKMECKHCNGKLLIRKGKIGIKQGTHARFV